MLFTWTFQVFCKKKKKWQNYSAKLRLQTKVCLIFTYTLPGGLLQLLLQFPHLTVDTETLIWTLFCLCITYIRCIHRFAQSFLPLFAGASCKSWALMSLGQLPKWLAAFAELHQCQYDCIKGSLPRSTLHNPLTVKYKARLLCELAGEPFFSKVAIVHLMNWRADSDSISWGEQHLIGPPGGRFTERGRVHGMPCIVWSSVQYDNVWFMVQDSIRLSCSWYLLDVCYSAGSESGVRKECSNQ